jgi:GTP-binding protein EngB required for normal cell division
MMLKNLYLVSNKFYKNGEIIDQSYFSFMTTHKYTICLIGVENVGKRTLLFELSGIGGKKQFFKTSKQPK